MLLGKPCVATAVAVAFPPPVAETSAVAVALLPSTKSKLSMGPPPVAVAVDDALPKPLVVAVLLASASPPRPPSVSEVPPPQRVSARGRYLETREFQIQDLDTLTLDRARHPKSPCP
jgi:hypothetical protein